MAELDQLPPLYRATAARIPPDVLKSATPAAALARVIAHDSAFETGLSMGSTLDAAPFFDAAGQLLDGRADPGPEAVAKAQTALAQHRPPAAAPTSARPGVIQVGPGRWTYDAAAKGGTPTTTTDMLYKSGGPA
jgi:hypothetical protein